MCSCVNEVLWKYTTDKCIFFLSPFYHFYEGQKTGGKSFYSKRNNMILRNLIFWTLEKMSFDVQRWHVKWHHRKTWQSMIGWYFFSLSFLVVLCVQMDFSFLHSAAADGNSEKVKQILEETKCATINEKDVRAGEWSGEREREGSRTCGIGVKEERRRRVVALHHLQNFFLWNMNSRFSLLNSLW